MLLHMGTRLTHGSEVERRAPLQAMSAFRRALRWIEVARGLAADTREDILWSVISEVGKES